MTNVISLSIVGRHIITTFGLSRFTIIFFLSAITGSLLNFSFSSYQMVLGASGGIFGLVGALLYAQIKFSHQLPGSVTVPTKTIFSIIVLQTFLDVMGMGGDIFSHFGGSAFGFSYALCILGNCSISRAPIPEHAEKYISIALAVSMIFSMLFILGKR